MNGTRKLWICLAILLAAPFSTLLWTGGEIVRQAPPMPDRVVATDGRVIYTRADIEWGRQVWQSVGGMQLGSIWGHGSAVAPDWSADGPHREAVAILDLWAAREAQGAGYDALPEEAGATLRSRLGIRIRTDTHDPTTGTITLDDDRMRVPDDALFSAGALTLSWSVAGFVGQAAPRPRPPIAVCCRAVGWQRAEANG